MRAHPLKNKRGQVLILAAFSLIVLIAFVGLAIDAGRGYGVKAKLNSAVDAAAIAAARALAEGESESARIAAAQSAAKEFYPANFPSKYLGATLVPLKDGDVKATYDATTKRWTVDVSGSAIMPMTLMGIFGFGDVAVAATGTTVRRDVDIVLVLDTSGSLGPPVSSADTLPKLKQAATDFVDQFNAGSGGDRVSVVSFSSGAVADVGFVAPYSRGFDKIAVKRAINDLAVTGSTASAEGMRVALNQINLIPVASRSDLRTIVFFSDGAPNSVPATFSNGGTLVTGDLYSETDMNWMSACEPTSGSPREACRLYWSDRRDSLRGTYPNIVSLPDFGFNVTGVGAIPLASYRSNRLLTGTPISNTRCNVNKAARNMVENVANTARGQGVTVHTIALGVRVNTLELVNGFCATYDANPAKEFGVNVLKRLANSVDSDTKDPLQPIGLYVWAENASDLASAFSAIASEILRLSR